MKKLIQKSGEQGGNNDNDRKYTKVHPEKIKIQAVIPFSLSCFFHSFTTLYPTPRMVTIRKS